MQNTLFGALWYIILLSVVAAAAPPDSCDPGAIRKCLDRFEIRYAECGEGDLYCQCMTVLRTGGSCYSACPQEAMTTFIKTFSDGACATFDPHMQARSVEDKDIKAARIKTWLGIDVVEDHAPPDKQNPGARVLEARQNSGTDINSGDAQVDREAAVGNDAQTGEGASAGNETRTDAEVSASSSTVTLPRRPKTGKSSQHTTNNTIAKTPALTLNRGSSSSSASGAPTTLPVLHPTDSGTTIVVKALTITALEPTTTSSLSPQEYQSRLEKLRYKENLRSIRSEQRRISSEQEAQRALASSRLAAATFSMGSEAHAEKDVVAKVPATATVASAVKIGGKVNAAGAKSAMLHSPLLALVVIVALAL